SPVAEICSESGMLASPVCLNVRVGVFIDASSQRSNASCTIPTFPCQGTWLASKPTTDKRFHNFAKEHPNQLYERAHYSRLLHEQSMHLREGGVWDRTLREVLTVPA